MPRVLAPSLLFLLLLLPGLLAAQTVDGDAPSTPTLELRGYVVPLYAYEPDFDYGTLLHETAEAGANAVSILVVLMQDNAESTQIYAKPHRTCPDDAVRRTIRQARAEGLAPMLFPIVLLENPQGDDWRGSLRPATVHDWFESYRTWMRHYARMAREEGCAWMSVGSELSSMEQHGAEWRETIAAVRTEFPGSLLYSANWDHIDGPDGWWTELDAMGLSSYYEIARTPDATQAELDAGWREWRDWVLEWHAHLAPNLPIVFTELGYPSRDGGAMKPWDYTTDAPVDLEEQRMAYRAFIAAWDGRPEMHGVFAYAWVNFGKNEESSYALRGKPAAELLKNWYRPQRVHLTEP